MKTKNLILFIAIPSLFFSLLNCNGKNYKGDSILGNWKSVSPIAEGRFYTEIYIDKETINIFSEEVNDIIFSKYYLISDEKLYALDNNKKDTLFEIKYRITGDKMKLTSEKFNSGYVRIKKGNTLKDYINEDLTLEEYLNDFNIRKSR